MEILVYIQIKNGEIEDFSYDLISYAREISLNAKISGVVVLPYDSSVNFELLNKFGADKLYIIRTDKKEFDKTQNGGYITELVKKINPEIFILNSTTEGREIAPIVASSLNTGLTADCTKLEIKDNKLVSTRPTYGGKLMASILCKKTPQMATVRINTFKKKEFEKNNSLEIEETHFDIKEKELEITDFKEETGCFFELENARIILAGGMGLKNKEGFEKLKHLASLMGAKAAGTRKAVENGFIEKKYQIGQTGTTVTPDIYLAFGISGAIHHIVGMENSKKIIAINTDKNAPIFNHSDIGVVADANGVIDFLIEKYKN